MTATATIPMTRAGRIATPADVPTISATLASAFLADPVFEWIIPDDARRRAALEPVFTTFAEAFVPHGASRIAGGTAAALWAPPGVAVVADEDAERFAEELGEACGEGAERAFALMEVLEEHHPAEPCAHLQFLGVRPDDQSQGFGSALLAPVLAAWDREGVPAYLEATSDRNVRLYERHGFRIVGTLTAAGSPPLRAMWRDPRPVS